MGNTVLKPLTLILLFCCPHWSWAAGDRLHLEEGKFNLAQLEKPATSHRTVPKFDLEVKDGSFRIQTGNETLATGNVEVVTDSAGRAFLMGTPDQDKQLPSSSDKFPQLLAFKIRYNYSKVRHYLAKRPASLAPYREGTLVVEWLQKGQRVIEKDKQIQIRKIEMETAQLAGATLDPVTELTR